MPVLLVLLIVVALVVVGGGVVFFRSRLRRGAPIEPSAAPTPIDTRPKGPASVVAEAPAPVPSAPSASEEPVGAAPVPEPQVESGVVETDTQPAGEASAVEEIVRPRFRDRLGKARSLLGGYFSAVVGRAAIEQGTWDDLEEALIRADVGINTTTALLGDLKTRVKAEGITSGEALLEALKSDLKGMLASPDRSMHFEPGRPNVWLFVGVNGVGKTTTIGKIGKKQVADGRTVIMAAGDTFRAAAAEQLGMWAERTGAQLVRGAEGGDPGSVIFDAVERAAARNVDLVLGDTAGRLQTKTNLMEELRKIRRIANKEPGIVSEVLLVLDATTGQNGLVQAKQFGDVAELTGVVLTKLDGTAKGGIAFAIQTELGIPIKLVGLGEGADDLVEFDPDEYVEALFN